MAQIATFYDHILDISRQEGVSAVEAMKKARALGVELLEVSQGNLAGRAGEVARELDAAGLGVSSVPAFFNFGQDADVEKQSAAVLEDAKALGAGKLLVIPGFFRPEDEPEERAKQTEQIAACINRLADLAAARGIGLIMEDFDNSLSPCASAEQVRFFLDRCPGLSACFDTGNFRFSAGDELEAYRLLRDRVGHVHLKDRAYRSASGERPLTAADGKDLYPCPVGSGDLRIGELISLLREDGYDGAYSLEFYGAAKTLEYLARSVEWVRERI